MPTRSTDGAGDGPAGVDLADHVGDGDAHLLEEHLVEVGDAGGLHERADVDARARHVDEDERDAAVLGHVGVGAHEQEAPVAALGGGVPHLLTVDDELLAVAHGAAGERRPGRCPRPAR